MAFTFNDTDKAVQEFLNKAGIKYCVNYVGAMEHEEWKHDLFTVHFIVAGKSPLITEYKTGIGHRLELDKFGKPSKDYNASRKAMEAHKELAALDDSRFGVGENRGFGYTKFVPAPTAAGVLYSIIMDASALDENFDDWASNYGYDSDSLKALNIYKACCDNGRKLRALFTREQLEALQELLQDY